MIRRVEDQRTGRIDALIVLRHSARQTNIAFGDPVVGMRRIRATGCEQNKPQDQFVQHDRSVRTGDLGIGISLFQALANLFVTELPAERRQNGFDRPDVRGVLFRPALIENPAQMGRNRQKSRFAEQNAGIGLQTGTDDIPYPALVCANSQAAASGQQAVQVVIFPQKVQPVRMILYAMCRCFGHGCTILPRSSEQSWTTFSELNRNLPACLRHRKNKNW